MTRDQMIRGIWSVPVPMPNSQLRYTLSYVLETPRGPVLVDPGYDEDASWASLVNGLAAGGIDVRDCYGVLITHAHSDHHGLSRRVREASGAWIAMHPADAALLKRGYLDAPWKQRLTSLMVCAGAPLDEVDIPQGQNRPNLHTPDRLITDGEILDVPGWTVQAVWTPGHTPGHISYHVHEANVLLTGDLVLPTVLSRSGVAEATSDTDPFGQLLTSLGSVARLNIRTALPAHQGAFGTLPERCTTMLSEHRAELARVEKALARYRHATAWQVASSVERRRDWTTLAPHRKRIVVIQTLGHLRHLVATGTAVEVDRPGPAPDDGIAYFGLASPTHIGNSLPA